MDTITYLPRYIWCLIVPQCPRHEKLVRPIDTSDSIPLKFVFANFIFGYSTKVFISDSSYYNFYAWLPKTEKQKKGENIPILYSENFHYLPDSLRILYFNFRGVEEPYLRIYKYYASDSWMDQKELFCFVRRTVLIRYIYYYSMEFKTGTNHLYFNVRLPIADFKIGDKRYRWLYYHERNGITRSYYYSLYEANDDEVLMCDKFIPGTGFLDWDWYWKVDISTHTAFDRFKLKNKIADFTYSTLPPIFPFLSFQKSAKLHTFQKGLTSSIDSIDDTNLVFLVTALILKTHQDYKNIFLGDDGSNDPFHRPTETRLN